jgi:hypothetical protein
LAYIALVGQGRRIPLVSPIGNLIFEKWRTRIQLCVRHDQVLLALAAYLAAWKPQDINRLPIALTEAIGTIDELHHRAIDLALAEVNFKGSNADWALLRELALVVGAAAARARYLETLPVH